VAAFFIERILGNGQVQGEFLRVRGNGSVCAAGNNGNATFTYRLSLTQ
jgi:hypothetical protein